MISVMHEFDFRLFSCSVLGGLRSVKKKLMMKLQVSSLLDCSADLRLPSPSQTIHGPLHLHQHKMVCKMAKNYEGRQGQPAYSIELRNSP